MVEAKEVEPIRPYWFERLGMKGGEPFNVALRLLAEKLEAIEARLASLEKATSSWRPPGFVFGVGFDDK